MTIKRLYVSGVKDDIEESDLKEYFGQYGQIEDVEVITDKDTKKKRGFAFITFDDYDPVDKVVCELISLLFFILLTLQSI